MSEWKRRAPGIRKEGRRWYATFWMTDGRMKRVRLPDDERKAREEHADLSRRFIAGDYVPPLPKRRPSRPNAKQHSSQIPKPVKTNNNPAFVWPIPLSAGRAGLELPTTDLSEKDLAILQLSLNQFQAMLDLLREGGDQALSEEDGIMP